MTEIPITWPRPLAAIDLETTGLDPTTGEITEIGVVLADEHLRETHRERIRVQTRERDRERACEWVRAHTAWGRATPAEWRALGAWSRQRAFSRLGELLEGRALVAHHLPFERAWLTQEYARWLDTMPGRDWVVGLDWSRHSIDTRELASPLLAQGLIEGRGLARVCAYLEIELDHHDALSDAAASLEIARRLLARRSQ